MPIDADFVAREPETEELVFVGGPADGKRLRVRVRDHLYNYMSTEPHPEHGLPMPRIDVYKRMQMSVAIDIGEWVSETLMRHDGLDELGALRRLLLGYQRKPRQASTRPTASQMTDRMRRSQRPHPHTEDGMSLNIDGDFYSTTFRWVSQEAARAQYPPAEDYLVSDLQETQEANDRAEAAGLSMEGQS